MINLPLSNCKKYWSSLFGIFVTGSDRSFMRSPCNLAVTFIHRAYDGEVCLMQEMN